MPGIKFLLSGVERSGKSTTTSKIKNGLVFSFDSKKYPFKVPHKNIDSFNGMNLLKKTMNETIKSYKERYGDYPKTVVMDTVTQLYTMITKFCMDRFNGFDVHTNINKETLAFNEYVEKVLIPHNINVVIVAHTVYDVDTGRYIIPATGSFSKTGSWLSVVDNASYVHIENDSIFFIEHKNLKYPCRSTLVDIPEGQPISEYDINAHIEMLEKQTFENEEFSF